MLNFQTTPVPHEEARRRIADKPAVARDVFDRLPEEMQARAFTITGIEDMDVVQAVRDEIAKLPAGADWDTVKREVMAKISPWFTAEGAAARAQTLMSHHAFAAYSATQARIMDEMIDVFPFRQYLSTGDGKVRASHRALHEIILPATHVFWTYHTPPWEWNCRCQVVELTEEDRDEEYARDEKRAPEHRRVLEGASLRQLDQGSLNRGLSTNVDVRTPKERGGNYQWSARDQSVPYDEIRKRWDSQTATDFEGWARGVELEGGGDLLSYLSGKPTTPGPQTLTQPRPETFAAALAKLGLDAKAKWSRKDIADLKSSLRLADPAQQGDHIASITGARRTGALTETEIRRTVQDLLDIVPRSVADTLPKLQIKLVDTSLGGANGQYDPGKHVVEVTTANLRGSKGEKRRRELRRVLSHELMHWMHLSAKGPAADAYRAAIKAHYAARTAGEPLIGGQYRRDKWWDLYAGKEYRFEKGDPAGVEVPTRYYELWETPDILASVMDPAQNPDAAAIRETFSLVHSFFDTVTP
jgi:hypothetical protein